MVLLCDQKYQKSFKRAFLPLKKYLPRARVCRASHAWRARATNGETKVGGFTAPRNLILPRVRTYHTKEPSRFVHALPARPLKVQGGRGFGLFVDGIGVISAILSIGYTRVISCRGRRLDDPLLSRGEHCSPAKRHKDTFILSYFSMTKRTKSQQGGLTPSSFRTTGGVHELVARAMRGKCVRYGTMMQVGSFAALHSFIYTTRANTAHEKAEQIRARIACTPAYKGAAGVGVICA